MLGAADDTGNDEVAAAQAQLQQQGAAVVGTAVTLLMEVRGETMRRDQVYL